MWSRKIVMRTHAVCSGTKTLGSFFEGMDMRLEAASLTEYQMGYQKNGRGFGIISKY
jgi:hypothetical protein